MDMKEAEDRWDSMLVRVEEACLQRATNVSQHPENGCPLNGMSRSRSSSASDTCRQRSSERHRGDVERGVSNEDPAAR